MNAFAALFSPKETLKAMTVPVVLVVLLFAAIFGAKGCARGSIADAAAAAKVAQGKVEAGERNLAKANADLVLAHEDRSRLEVENAALRARLDARPAPRPRPTPPPAAQAEELTAAGVATPLPPDEALKVWTWKAQADMVPALQARAAAADDLIAGQARENQALRIELEKSTQVIVAMATQKADLQDQVKALNVQLAASVRAERVGTVEKVAEMALVALVSYAGGRASK